MKFLNGAHCVCVRLHNVPPHWQFLVEFIYFDVNFFFQLQLASYSQWIPFANGFMNTWAVQLGTGWENKIEMEFMPIFSGWYSYDTTQLAMQHVWWRWIHFGVYHTLNAYRFYCYCLFYSRNFISQMEFNNTSLHTVTFFNNEKKSWCKQIILSLLKKG